LEQIIERETMTKKKYTILEALGESITGNYNNKKEAIKDFYKKNYGWKLEEEDMRTATKGLTIRMSPFHKSRQGKL
jgi:hypothetical protein